LELASAFGSMKGAKGPDGKPKGPLMVSGDLRKIMWGFLIAGLGGGAYKLAEQLARRSINPNVDLQDRVESIHLDPVILQSFLKLQEWRKISAPAFKTAIQNVDNLLFLESALMSQEINPQKTDKVLAFTYLRIALNRLTTFQNIVKEQLGNQDAFTVNMYVKPIHEQLLKHTLNILHLCSQFNPERTVQRARGVVEDAMKQLREGKTTASFHRWLNDGKSIRSGSTLQSSARSSLSSKSSRTSHSLLKSRRRHNQSKGLLPRRSDHNQNHHHHDGQRGYEPQMHDSTNSREDQTPGAVSITLPTDEDKHLVGDV